MDTYVRSDTIVRPMWMRSSVVIVVACCAVSFTHGCGPNQALAAVNYASRDGQCPSESIKVQELGSDRFKTVGCGRSAVYECWNDTCWREGHFASQARVRASREFDCSPGAIQVRWVQDETYSVHGCNRSATYRCDEGQCVPESSGEGTGPTFIVVP